eukprot:522041_1
MEWMKSLCTAITKLSITRQLRYALVSSGTLIVLSNTDKHVSSTPIVREDSLVNSLSEFSEIPIFLADNPHIINGYRRRSSVSQCIKSVFRIHNETFNIWSHFLGAILFAVLFARLMFYVPSNG